MKEYKIHEKMYCIEERVTPNKSELVFILCALNPKDRTEFQISRATMIVSSIFLILTIVLLLLRSQPRTLMDKVVISYCFALTGAYTVLTLIQFEIHIFSCTFIGK